MAGSVKFKVKVREHTLLAVLIVWAFFQDMQRTLHQERTLHGLDRWRANHRDCNLGRPPKDPQLSAKICYLVCQDKSVREMVALLGVSQATIYRRLGLMGGKNNITCGQLKPMVQLQFNS